MNLKDDLELAVSREKLAELRGTIRSRPPRQPVEILKRDN